MNLKTQILLAAILGVAFGYSNEPSEVFQSLFNDSYHPDNGYLLRPIVLQNLTYDESPEAEAAHHIRTGRNITGGLFLKKLFDPEDTGGALSVASTVQIPYEEEETSRSPKYSSRYSSKRFAHGNDDGLGKAEDEDEESRTNDNRGDAYEEDFEDVKERSDDLEDYPDYHRYQDERYAEEERNNAYPVTDEPRRVTSEPYLEVQTPTSFSSIVRTGQHPEDYETSATTEEEEDRLENYHSVQTPLSDIRFRGGFNDEERRARLTGSIRRHPIAYRWPYSKAQIKGEAESSNDITSGNEWLVEVPHGSSRASSLEQATEDDETEPEQSEKYNEEDRRADLEDEEEKDDENNLLQSLDVEGGDVEDKIYEILSKPKPTSEGWSSSSPDSESFSYGTTGENDWTTTPSTYQKTFKPQEAVWSTNWPTTVGNSEPIEKTDNPLESQEELWSTKWPKVEKQKSQKQDVWSTSPRTAARNSERYRTTYKPKSLSSQEDAVWSTSWPTTSGNGEDHQSVFNSKLVQQQANLWSTGLPATTDSESFKKIYKPNFSKKEVVWPTKPTEDDSINFQNVFNPKLVEKQATIWSTKLPTTSRSPESYQKTYKPNFLQKEKEIWAIKSTEAPKNLLDLAQRQKVWSTNATNKYSDYKKTFKPGSESLEDIWPTKTMGHTKSYENLFSQKLAPKQVVWSTSPPSNNLGISRTTHNPNFPQKKEDIRPTKPTDYQTHQIFNPNRKLVTTWSSSLTTTPTNSENFQDTLRPEAVWPTKATGDSHTYQNLFRPNIAQKQEVWSTNLPIRKPETHKKAHKPNFPQSKEEIWPTKPAEDSKSLFDVKLSQKQKFWSTDSPKQSDTNPKTSKPTRHPEDSTSYQNLFNPKSQNSWSSSSPTTSRNTDPRRGEISDWSPNPTAIVEESFQTLKTNLIQDQQDGFWSTSAPTTAANLENYSKTIKLSPSQWQNEQIWTVKPTDSDNRKRLYKPKQTNNIWSTSSTDLDSDSHQKTKPKATQWNEEKLWIAEPERPENHKKLFRPEQEQNNLWFSTTLNSYQNKLTESENWPTRLPNVVDPENYKRIFKPELLPAEENLWSTDPTAESYQTTNRPSYGDIWPTSSEKYKKFAKPEGELQGAWSTSSSVTDASYQVSKEKPASEVDWSTKSSPVLDDAGLLKPKPTDTDVRELWDLSQASTDKSETQQKAESKPENRPTTPSVDNSHQPTDDDTNTTILIKIPQFLGPVVFVNKEAKQSVRNTTKETRDVVKLEEMDEKSNRTSSEGTSAGFNHVEESDELYNQILENIQSVFGVRTQPLKGKNDEPETEENKALSWALVPAKNKNI